MSEPPAILHGPTNSRFELLVFSEGLLSAAAHDLLLRVEAFEIALGPGHGSVAVRADARSLRVVTAMRGGRALPGALSAADARQIEATVAREILRSQRYPEIGFTSTEVVAAPDGRWDVRGALTLVGVTRPLALAVRHERGRLAAEATVHQPAFGIRPYRAMLGGLRVKPDVFVRVSVPDEAAP